MSDLEPEKMKVTELRDELKNRGLDGKGTKAVLVKRLKAAIKKEQGLDDGEGDTSVGDLDTSQEEHDDSSQDISKTMDDSVQEQEAVPNQNGTSDGPPTEEVSQPMDEDESKDQEPEKEGTTAEGEDAVPDSEEFQTVDEIHQEDDGKDDKRGEKRKRSRSRSRDRHRRRSPKRRSPIRVEMDDESWETGTKFLIDRFNSDLNLRILDDGLKANPLTVEGFAFMWAGCRAMFGVKTGKVAFEVKLLENLNVDHLPEEESHPHVCRVGWSVDSSSMQLGEEPFSYGYGGTGKASTDCKFNDFGEKFTAGDVITSYVDFETEPITISYSKNGEDLGTCFEIEKETLEDQALFPHILSKNTEFQLNFGAQEEPWFPLKEGFIFCEAVQEDDRVRGTTPLAKKEECEVLMMVGLPGAGKTVWAEKHASEFKDKRYNVLGSNNIIDKMKVMGLPRKKNYAGRWDVLIDKSIKCLNRLIEIAARKKRNYILDQTNVYASARRRKMAPFEGFQRKAVVVVPTDEEFKSRIAKREKEEGKDVPEKAVLEMKANFTIPEEGTIFDGIILPELEKTEAAELVEKYVKEGKEALPPQKRFRKDKFGRGRFDRDRRDRRDRRGGYNDRGGWDRNRDRDRFGGDRRRDSYGSRSGGYRSGGGGGGYGGNSGGYGGGYGGNKGRQGSWGGNQGGNWGNQGGNWGNQWGGNQSQGYGGGSNWNYGSGNQNYGSGQWSQQQGGWGGNQGYWGGGNQGYNQNQSYGSSGSGQWGNYQSGYRK